VLFQRKSRTLFSTALRAHIADNMEKQKYCVFYKDELVDVVEASNGVKALFAVAKREENLENLALYTYSVSLQQKR